MYQGPVFVQGSQFLPESLIFCSRVSFLISGLHFLQGSQFSYLGLISFMCVSFLFFSLHSSNRGLILLGDVTIGLILCGRVSILNEGLNFPIWVSFLLCGSHFFFFFAFLE